MSKPNSFVNAITASTSVNPKKKLFFKIDESPLESQLDAQGIGEGWKDEFKIDFGKELAGDFGKISWNEAIKVSEDASDFSLAVEELDGLHRGILCTQPFIKFSLPLPSVSWRFFLSKPFKTFTVTKRKWLPSNSSM